MAAPTPSPSGAASSTREGGDRFGNGLGDPARGLDTHGQAHGRQRPELGHPGPAGRSSTSSTCSTTRTAQGSARSRPDDSRYVTLRRRRQREVHPRPGRARAAPTSRAPSAGLETNSQGVTGPVAGQPELHRRGREQVRRRHHPARPRCRPERDAQPVRDRPRRPGDLAPPTNGAITNGQAADHRQLHPGERHATWPTSSSTARCRCRSSRRRRHDHRPTLGTDQLHAGLLAGIIGLALVVLYSLLHYRGLGLVTVASLADRRDAHLRLVVLLGQAHGFRLSLAGIAG